MSWWRKLVHLLGRRGFDGSLQEEIRLHLEARAEELRTSGADGPEAMATARREFGAVARASEESREAWRWSWIEDLLHDLRYAMRSLRRDPAFAAAAIVSLALGIGVNTTMFSLTAELLFSQPSVRDPDNLLAVQFGGGRSVPMPEYRFLRDAKVFDGLAGANQMQEVNWRATDASVRLFATRVTENFFEVTGTPIAAGRTIGAQDREVVVISHGFWLSRMHGNPAAIGQALALDGRPHTIIGVLPPIHRTLIGFGYAPDLYLPVSEAGRVALYGRLPDGMPRLAMLARLRALGGELDRIYPDGAYKWASGVSITHLTGVERLTAGFLPTMSILFASLMAVVGLLLVIACGNVASLLLARAAARAQEFAIRMSIGAGRGRVVRQLLAESLLLSLLGTAGGLALNYALTRLLNGAALPAPFPLLLSIEPDSRLLLYSAIVAVMSAVLAGLLPALQATRQESSALLKSDEHQVSGRRATLRNALVSGQLAVSVLVLVIAALSIRNLIQSAKLDPGFDLQRTTWAQIRLVPENYSDATKVRAMVSLTLDKLRGIPGVAAAASAAVVPLNDHFLSRTTPVYTGSSPQGLRIEHAWNSVGPDYFRTMEIAILAGREFSVLDREAAQPVVILNEAFARRAFSGQDATGRRIRFGSAESGDRMVVGVARNSKYSTIGEKDRPAVYEPYFQTGGRATVNLLIRTSAQPESMVKALTAALLRVEPAAAVEVKPMSRATAFALLPSRAGALLLGVTGLLGLALASVGLYGVLAYSISRRTREIGLRVALGARRRQVLWLVLREGAWILSGGLATGALLGVLATRPLARFLTPGVTATDPATYLAVAAVLLAVGCAACLAPALRAVRIDPMAALRHD